MGFQITGMSLKNLVSKPVTKCYPDTPRVYIEGTRGHVENDMEKCILCGICEKTCPATALTVDKDARSWTINRFSCVQCGACVRACPPKSQSLSMHPEYNPVATTMSSETLTKPAESQEEPTR